MPLTKAQIIQSFSLLDLATLQQLYNYSSLLIIPQDDLLVNATMDQMYAKAQSLAAQYFPQWTDWSETDLGRFIVELICLFSEKDFWYINAFANESLLAKMSVYSDAFTRAIELGYSPVLCQGANGTFNVTFPAGSSTDYPRGSLVVTLANGLTFTNDYPFNVPTSGSPSLIAVGLSEGTYVSDSASFNGHSILLYRNLIDINSLQVTIANIQWNNVRTFAQSSSSSPDFVVLPQANGQASIFFGSGGYGITPALSTPVTLSYRTCSAEQGNSAIQSCVVTKSISGRAPTAIEMTTVAVGGTSPESLISIQNNAPLYYSTKGAAVNEYAMESILNSYPEVSQSNVQVVGNYVYFKVIPKDGTVADSTLLTTLTDRIQPYIMLGYTALGVATTYISMASVSMQVYLLRGYNVSETYASVLSLVEDYTDPLVLAQYGGGFNLTDLSLLIRSQVAGVQNVVFSIVQGVAAANISVDPGSIMERLSDGDITLTVTSV